MLSCLSQPQNTHCTYLGLFSHREHRPLRKAVFCAIFVISFQMHHIYFISNSRSCHQVFLDWHLFLFLWEFHVTDCLVMLDVGLLMSDQSTSIFLISFFTGSCLVLYQRMLFITLLNHFKLIILHRQHFTKVCIFFSICCVMRHVSELYSNTDLTLEFNILFGSWLSRLLLILLPRYVTQPVSSNWFC